MALKGTLSRLLLNGLSIGTVVGEVDVELTTTENESTVLESTGGVFDPGLASASATINGFLSGVDGGEEDEIETQLATPGGYVTFIPQYTASAPIPAYFFPYTFTNELAISTSATGLIGVNGGFSSGRNGAKRAYVLDFARTASGTGEGGEVDFGSAGSAGGKAILHVTAITGSATNAQFTVESSVGDTFGSPTDHGTIQISAVGAYELEFSGAVGDYLRCNVESLGGATNITYTITVQVANVT